MLKRTITYTDYDGTERKEDFYFNMNKAEILEMEMSKEGGMKQLLEKIIQTQDVPKIIYYFKEIILKAYGEKSPDGKRFIKSKELTEAFTQTEAFSNLYIKLATDDKYASDFINELYPEKIMNELREAFEKNQNNSGSVSSPALVPSKPE